MVAGVGIGSVEVMVAAVVVSSEEVAVFAVVRVSVEAVMIALVVGFIIVMIVIVLGDSKEVVGTAVVVGSVEVIESIRFALVNTPEKGEAGFDQSRDFIESICPVEQKCSIDGDISPKTCVWIEEWVTEIKPKKPQ